MGNGTQKSSDLDGLRNQTKGDKGAASETNPQSPEPAPATSTPSPKG